MPITPSSPPRVGLRWTTLALVIGLAVLLVSGCASGATSSSGSSATRGGQPSSAAKAKAKRKAAERKAERKAKAKRRAKQKKKAKARAARARAKARQKARAGQTSVAIYTHSHPAGPAWTIAEARSALPKLRVRWYGSMAGYSRDNFGPAWADMNHNGCDTRNDILNRDLVKKTWKYPDHCEVETGILHDPYTGQTIHFQRGVGSSLAVQIDHMVALGDAWQTAAKGWSSGKREQFANDPRELIAVSGSANDEKGDDDAARWLPPNRAFDCQYAADQVMIKRTYGLWVSPPEKAALSRVLSGCR